MISPYLLWMNSVFFILITFKDYLIDIIESSEKDKRLGKFLAVIGGICSLIP